MGQCYPGYKENVFHRKIKESKYDIYTMDYISQSPIHCSKGNLKCVLKGTKFPVKQANGYMFKTNCSSIEHQYKKLGAL